MTRFIALIAATLTAGTAFAGQSDRYHDLRLDTSLTGEVYSAGAGASRPNGRPADLWLETFDRDQPLIGTLSSRSAPVREGFINGGSGVGNDSR